MRSRYVNKKAKMLKRIFSALKKKGILELVSSGLFKFRRKKINNYEIYFTNLSRKSGLEIGGPTRIFRKRNILPVYPIVADLDGCNFSKTTTWEGKIKEGMTYRYYKNRKGYQFVCDAIELTAIQSQTYDFVLSSHAVEHIANPFRATSEWLRVLKDNGIILLVLPHKDGTFDHNRPITSLNHLIEDFKKNVKEDDLTHLPEILKLHDLNLDSAAGNFELFRERSMDNYKNRCLHHHVFNTELVIEIFNYFNLQIISVDPVLPYHIIVMGRKLLSKEMINNDTFLGKGTQYAYVSPFPSDKK